MRADQTRPGLSESAGAAGAPSGLEGQAFRTLFEAAGRARERAYAPYSGFAVGAAVMDEAGRVHAGCNVENASYPEGICAETAAIAAMVAAGGRRIARLCLVASGAVPITPCGGCRQRIAEFAEPDCPIHCCDEAGERARLTLGALLPHAFDFDAGPR